jgi:hypothetical protein
MLQWLTFFFKISRLQSSPQDAPLSQSAQYLAIASYWLLGVVIISVSQSVIAAMFLSAVQTGLLIFFTNVSLWIRKTPERITQTITALSGTGALIAAISLPFIFTMSQGATEASIMFNIVWLVLVVWETAVIAHILRSAMDIHIVAAAGMAMVFLYLSTAITFRLMRVIAYTATS